MPTDLPSGRGSLSHEDAAALAQHFAPDWLRGADDAKRAATDATAPGHFLTREDTLHLAAVYSTEGDLRRAAYWGGYTAQIVRDGPGDGPGPHTCTRWQHKAPGDWRDCSDPHCQAAREGFDAAALRGPTPEPGAAWEYVDCRVCGSRVYRGAERCSCGSPRPGVDGWSR